MISITMFKKSANISIDGKLIAVINFTSYKQESMIIEFFLNNVSIGHFFYDSFEVV